MRIYPFQNKHPSACPSLVLSTRWFVVGLFLLAILLFFVSQAQAHEIDTSGDALVTTEEANTEEANVEEANTEKSNNGNDPQSTIDALLSTSSLILQEEAGVTAQAWLPFVMRQNEGDNSNTNEREQDELSAPVPTAEPLPTATPGVIENAAEETSADAHDHAHDDLVGVSMALLEAEANPNAGLAPPEVQAAQTGPSNQVGSWSPVISAPIVPIFVSLLPNGNVLMWDSVSDVPSDETNVHTSTRSAVWNPTTNSFVRTDVSGFNLFCAGYEHLPDGRLFVAGGNKDAQNNGIAQTHLFDFRTNSWSRGPDMAYERWYPSVAALPNGEQLILAGGPNTPEVRNLDSSLRTLISATLTHNRDYPFIQTGLDGRVLYAGPYPRLRMLNTNGTGKWQSFGNREVTYRSYGSYAMYDIGKLLVAGGGRPPVANTVTIDLNSGTPITAASGNMIYARRQANLTILADGTLLATGGLSSNASLVDLNAAVYAAELWNPATGAWRELSNMQVARQYHSTALLLPDGRVMVGGGGICKECRLAGYLRKDLQIFSPPYLFNSFGSPATRPTIRSAPSSIYFGQVFRISSFDAPSIRKAALVRLGAPTHSQDMGQRYIPLTIDRDSDTVYATGPANANIAPLGYYMLFLINDRGVPSIAKMVQVVGNAPGSFTSTATERHSGKCMDLPSAQSADGAQLQQFTCNGSAAQSFRFNPVAGTTNTYTLVNTKSNKCLDIAQASFSDGARLIQWRCSGSYNQQFRTESVGGGYYRLVAVHSNKCLDVSDGISTNDGMPLVQWRCDGTQSQQWQIAR